MVAEYPVETDYPWYEDLWEGTKLAGKTAGNVGVDLAHLIKWAGYEVPKYFATDFDEDIARGVSFLSREDVGIGGLKDWALGQIRAGHDMFMSDEIEAGTADKWIPDENRLDWDEDFDVKMDADGNWNVDIKNYGEFSKWRLNDLVKQAEGYMNDVPGTSFSEAIYRAADNIGKDVSPGLMEALPEPIESGLSGEGYWSDYFDTSENRFANVMAPEIPQEYVDTMGSMPGLGITPWLLSKIYNKMAANKPIHKGIQGTASLGAMQFGLPKWGNAAFQIARNKALRTKDKRWLYPEIAISSAYPHTSKWIGAKGHIPLPIPGSSKIIKDGKISYKPHTIPNIAAITGAGIAAESIRPKNMPDFLSWIKPSQPSPSEKNVSEVWDY